METKNDIARSRSKQRGWGIVSTILVTAVLIFAIVLLSFRILGYSIYTVMSGSMEPKFHVGSLIYVKPVDVTTLKEGDIITFVADEDKTIVTHRIIAITKDENNSAVIHFQTKGDANAIADGAPVDSRNVLGKPDFSIPLIGYLAFYIQRPPGLYIALVAAVVLLCAVFLPVLAKGKEKRTAKKE